MAKYTTELRTILENEAGRTTHADYSEIPAVIEEALPKLFDFDYPIFDPAYKNVLETKIVKHFWFREIGQETYGKFHFYLDTLMNEVMPYFNKLYESELLEFNPLYDTDFTKSHSGSENGDNVFTKDNTRTLDTKDETSGTVTDSGDELITHNSSSDKYGNSYESGSNSTTKTGGGREDISHEVTKENDTSRNTDRETERVTEGGSVDLDKTTSGTLFDNGTESSNGTSNDTTKKVVTANDTPQGGLPADYEQSTMYLTGWSGDDTKSNGSTTGNRNHVNSQTSTGGEFSEETRNLETNKERSHTYTDRSVEQERAADVHTKDDHSDENGSYTKDSNFSENDNTNASDRTEFGKVVSDTGEKKQTGTIKDSAKDTQKIKNLTQYTEHVTGHMSGNISKALMEFRETFLNIDMQVIDSLKPLFMGIY